MNKGRYLKNVKVKNSQFVTFHDKWRGRQKLEKVILRKLLNTVTVSEVLEYQALIY